MSSTRCICFLAFCAVWVYAIEQEVKHVTLKFTPKEVEVVKSVLRTRDTDLGNLHRSKGVTFDSKNKHENGVYIAYHLDDKEYHTHSIRNPRHIFGDWHHPGTTQRTGTSTHLDEGWLTITVPERATHLTVNVQGTWERKHSPSTQHKVQLPKEPYFVSHPKYAIQQEANSNAGVAGEAQLLVDMSKQVGNPSKHKNIVFLAGGYTAEEKTKYMATVQSVMDFFAEGKGTLSASPWNRYVTLINFYVVWQPSVNSGATYPLAADGTGGHPVEGEVLKLNNLDCKYGSKIIRLLNCDFQKMQDLAFSTTPADPEHTTIVTFVNDVEYGGSGGWRASSLYAGAWQQCDPNNRAPTGSNCIVINEAGKTVGWEPSLGNKYLRVMIHEIGHADADLADEYDYGFAEDQEIALENCYWNNDVSAVPWKAWIDEPLGVLQPSPVCSYTNYFKPTNGLCLMESEAANEYGPVCAETVIRAFYRDTEVLAAPRCPKEDEIMVITTIDELHNIGVPGTQFLDGPIANPLAAETGAHLNAPAGHPRATSDGRLPLRIDNGEILTKWTFPPEHGGTLTSSGTRATAVGNSQVSINGADLTPGDYVYTLEITDNSQFVLKSALGEDDPLVRNMTKVARFRVKVVASSDKDFGHCRQSALREFQDTSEGSNLNSCPFPFRDATTRIYCGICDAGKICNDSFPAISLVQAEANIDAAIEGVEDILFGLGGALILAGFIAFCAIWGFFAWYFGHDIQKCIPFPLVLRIARWVMMIFCIIIMLLAIAIVAIGVYQYNELSAFGKAFVLAAIVFAGILYILAFMGFTAAYFRSKVMLTINGIILTLLVLALLVLAILIFYIGNNTDSETLRDDLRKSWNSQVKKNPKSVCSFETVFQCSGFINSCSKTTALNSECPINCDVTHRDNPDPCFDVFQYRIEENFTWGGLAVLGIVAVLLIGLIVNWAMCCCIRQRKQQIKARLQDKPANWSNAEEAEQVKYKAINILKNLTNKEREMMREQFSQHDKNGDGSLNPKELKKLYSKALDCDITIKDAEEAINKCDKSGDGRVNFDEFVGAFCNDEQKEEQKKKLLDDPRIAHLDSTEAEQLLREFRKVDRDGSGFINLTELRHFYKRLYGVDPDEGDLKRALRAVDNDGNGRINFFEFVQMFAGKAKPVQQSNNQKP